jgi:serine/threonine protein kinase/Tfp pilus assembly protein PilF
MLPEVGSEFLGFRLLGELGRGAFGRVYLAHQGDLASRPVALKVGTDLFDESQTLARLQHTNIVPIYSVHRAGTLQAVCMPYFGSTTLRDVYEDLQEQETLPVSGRGLLSALDSRRTGSDRPAEPGASADEETLPSPPRPEGDTTPSQPEGPRTRLGYLERLTYVEAVLWVAARLASGLAHAHERGIVHRDLKPANVLLTDEGQPMLLDFNLSEDRGLRSGAVAIGGTSYYMAPEHLEAYRGHRRPVDARSDLYSLGIILHELLTGRRLFAMPEGPPEDVIDRLIEDRLGPPPAVRPWNAAVTPAVESIIHHCLEPDPADRYQTALELHEDLERHLADRPLRHAAEPSLRERMSKWRRRHPAAFSLTTISVLGLVLIALFLAVAWLVIDDFRGTAARLHRSSFRAAFEQCQLLLNTAPDEGSTAHLARGVRLAREALDGYGVGGHGDWTLAPPVRSLPVAEQRSLREEVSELIQLEVRARIALAERGGNRTELTRALEQGVDRLDAAERLDPQPPAALFDERGRFQAALGRHDRAARDRARAARVPSASARDYYLLGTSLLARGELDRAEVPLSRAVALDPRRFWAWFALGICHSDQKRHDAAAHDFSVCTTLAPGFAWPHLNRGLALARSGRLVEARVAYHRALEIDPDFAEALVDRALVDLELDDPAQALRHLDRVIGLGRRSAPVLTARAEALARLGRRDEAERAYTEVIRGNPADPIALVARGFFRLGGDPAGAEEDFAHALDLDPHSARARLGAAYLRRQHDPRAALAQVESALAEDPEFGDALQLRALLRARLGDPGAEADVDCLLRYPTPRRLYNAACALSLLAQRSADPRLIARGLDLLRRALDSGLPLDHLAHDPDLDALRASPRFSAWLAGRNTP